MPGSEGGTGQTQFTKRVKGHSAQGLSQVTIPSQIRYVEYFERLKDYGPVPHVTLVLRSLIVHTVPRALNSKLRHYSIGPLETKHWSFADFSKKCTSKTDLSFRVLVQLHGTKETREVFTADAVVVISLSKSPLGKF